ncbi:MULTISPECIES: hypothetical protein [Paenibacillus]|nr:hypothetical protein [Paenibacillus odorifer]
MNCSFRLDLDIGEEAARDFEKLEFNRSYVSRIEKRVLMKLCH